MNPRFQTEVKNQTLYFITNGKDAPLEDLKQLRRNMFATCLKNNCKKILADDRAQEFSLSDLDFFELGEYHAGTQPAIVKLAVVCKEKDLQKMKLWENVAFNRGANVKTFTGIEPAEEWLNKD